MNPRSVAGPAPPAEEGSEYPRGLIPPTRRGRSQRLLGDVIVDMGFALRDAVEKAVTDAREQQRTTGQVLIESGLLRRDQLARALAERFGVDYIDLSVFDIDVGAVNLVDVEVAKRYQAVPVGYLADKTVLLAMADPTNVITLDEMAMITGLKIRPAAAAPEDITALISRLGRLEDAVADVEPDAEPQLEVTLDDKAETESPIVRLVHSIIAESVSQGASDVHFNPDAGDMQVLFRVDGV